MPQTIFLPTIMLVRTWLGGGGALIVKCMDPCGSIKGVLVVPRSYKIYMRSGYNLF